METQKREFTGIWIPREVVEDERLDWIDRALYGEIQSYNQCFKSNASLAERIGETERNVQKRLAKLKECGYVVQVAFDGRRRFLETRIYGHVRDVQPDTPTLSSRTPIDNNIDNKKKDEQQSCSAQPTKIYLPVDEDGEVSVVKKKARAPADPLAGMLIQKLKEANSLTVLDGGDNSRAAAEVAKKVREMMNTTFNLKEMQTDQWYADQFGIMLNLVFNVKNDAYYKANATSMRFINNNLNKLSKLALQ